MGKCLVLRSRLATYLACLFRRWTPISSPRQGPTDRSAGAAAASSCPNLFCASCFGHTPPRLAPGVPHAFELCAETQCDSYQCLLSCLKNCACIYNRFGWPGAVRFRLGDRESPACAESELARAALAQARISYLITMAERGVDRDQDSHLAQNMSSNMSVLVFENSSGRSRSVKRPRPVKSCTECRQVATYLSRAC